MARPALEVADVFRGHGAAWRHANRGHVSLLQLKVMSAIESCRTAAPGGHVARCEDCAHTTIAYNIVLNLTRVPSLEAFGRRPRCKPNRPDRPSSETLHITGSGKRVFHIPYRLFGFVPPKVGLP